MNIVCLDMEGVLTPEIWIAFAEASGIPELKRTTRDEPDYDKLMRWRIGILKEHGLGLKEIQETIAKIDPLPGAKALLDELRSITQVVILSDTFEEGDIVEKDQLLYTLDSSDADSSQTQAQNSYSQAQNSYQQAVQAKYPTADMTGTVSEVLSLIHI